MRCIPEYGRSNRTRTSQGHKRSPNGSYLFEISSGGGERLTYPKISVVNTLFRRKKKACPYVPSVRQSLRLDSLRCTPSYYGSARHGRRHVIDIHVTMTSCCCYSFHGAGYRRCAWTPMDVQGCLEFFAYLRLFNLVVHFGDFDTCCFFFPVSLPRLVCLYQRDSSYRAGPHPPFLRH